MIWTDWKEQTVNRHRNARTMPVQITTNIITKSKNFQSTDKAQTKLLGKKSDSGSHHQIRDISTFPLAISGSLGRKLFPENFSFHNVSSMKLMVSKWGQDGSTSIHRLKMSKTNSTGKNRDSFASWICCCQLTGSASPSETSSLSSAKRVASRVRSITSGTSCFVWATLI